MTKEEMITAIEAGNITEELVNAIVEFEWELDPYEVLNNYGHIDDEGVRERMAVDVWYALSHNPKDAIDYIMED